MDKLKTILQTELEKYTGQGANCIIYPVFDNIRQHYCAVGIDYPTRKQSADVVIFARILADKIVIEEDMTDKKLVDALL